MSQTQQLIHQLRRLVLAVWLASTLASVSAGADVAVANGDELKRAARSAAPGDTITLANGRWSDHNLDVKFLTHGTAERPIIVRAESPGGATFTGRSALEIKGDHIVIQGISFRDGHAPEDFVLQLRGNHCRVTQCEFTNYNPPSRDTRYAWLSLQGEGHRVDHCAFAGQNHSGVTLVVRLDSERFGGHIIDHNAFTDRKPGDANGFETIRIGTSTTSMKAGNCLVMKNLFRHCDGEIELISNKSCDNTYVGNTIERCAGCLTLRHGNDCVVTHNVIDGGNKKGTGGIRVVGQGHRIVGNVIIGTQGRADGAIGLSAAVPDAKLHEHAQVADILIAKNQFRDNRGEAICFTHGRGRNGRTQLPKKITIEHNQFVKLAEADVKTDLGKQLGEWSKNHFLADSLVTPVPWRLTQHDVGPDAIASLHSDAIANTHAFGEVDVIENLAYIIPHLKSATATSPAGTIVIDDADAILAGAWQVSSHTPPHVGRGYLHDQKRDKGKKSVTYPIRVAAGKYRVEMSHCTNIRRSTNTPVTIYHADGETTLRINQQQIPTGSHRLFRPLGTYRFEAGKSYKVVIATAGTEGKYVIADAIRLTPTPN